MVRCKTRSTGYYLWAGPTADGATFTIPGTDAVPELPEILPDPTATPPTSRASATSRAPGSARDDLHDRRTSNTAPIRIRTTTTSIRPIIGIRLHSRLRRCTPGTLRSCSSRRRRHAAAGLDSIPGRGARSDRAAVTMPATRIASTTSRTAPGAAAVTAAGASRSASSVAGPSAKRPTRDTGRRDARPRSSGTSPQRSPAATSSRPRLKRRASSSRVAAATAARAATRGAHCPPRMGGIAGEGGDVTVNSYVDISDAGYASRTASSCRAARAAAAMAAAATFWAVARAAAPRRRVGTATAANHGDIVTAR